MNDSEKKLLGASKNSYYYFNKNFYHLPFGHMNSNIEEI